MKILLTGGLGNVGNNVLEVLEGDGHDVTVFELQTKTTTARHERLVKKLKYDIVWGDITKEEEVEAAIEGVDPEAIIHLAAIIPPVAYIKPKLAEAVNVEGTKHVINCANAMKVPPRFVFSSSYSCCGSYNSAKEVVFQTPETPANARDLYGRQKQTCEEFIKDTYKGDWVILRFCRIIEPNFSTKTGPGTTQFLFFLPDNQRCHGGHPKDIGVACLNACKVEEAVGKTLPIGGDDSWRLTVGDMTEDLFNAVGIVGMSRDAYRQANPEVDDSWYFETWIDTDESQRILQYQNITYEEFMKQVARNTWVKRLFIRPFASIALRTLYKQSPFYKENKERRQTKSALSEKTSWEVICEVFPTAPESYEVPLS